MILYLMRHGQTDWNAEEKVQGWNDTPLNETGAEQARAAAGKLSGEKIETIYASDFKRARKSAAFAKNALTFAAKHAIIIKLIQGGSVLTGCSAVW